MIAGVGLCILSEYLPSSLRFAENYASQIMISYLVAGLGLLILKQPRLMFASFGCCAALAIYLKYAQIPAEILNRKTITPELIAEKSEALFPKIKIAHFNISDANEEADRMIEEILETEADIVSIQEVTPQWDLILENELGVNYPYFHTMLDLGIFGMSIFSKYVLLDIDTLYFEDVPNLTGRFLLSNQIDTIQFISSHTYPAFNFSSFEKLRGHLQVLTDFVRSSSMPLLAFGDYNVVSWSMEIQAFRDSTNLRDSRSGFMPSFSDGTISFFEVPLDHIFYSEHFDCLEFENLNGSEANHIGISGFYQLTKTNYVAKENQ